MAAKKKSASRKTSAAPKKAARAASKASKTGAKVRPKVKPKHKTGTKPGAKPATKPATAARTAEAAPAKSAPGGSSKAKADTVEGYIEKAGGWQSEAMRKLHDMVMDAAEGVEHGIKWAQPVYEKHGPLAFLRSARNHVTLGFWRGAEMIAPEGLLEGVGEKMKHLKIKSAADIPGAVFDLVKQAVKLNEEKGDPTRKKG